MNKDRERVETRRKQAMQTMKAWADQQERGFESTCLEPPQGWGFMKQEETFSFDVIPFVAGYGNRNADEGFDYWQRQYSIHRITRPGEEPKNALRYLCPYDNYKKPCCVCKKASQWGGPKEENPYRPQQRHIMIANGKLDKNLTGPFEILDVVYYNRGFGFGQQLLTTINAWRGEESIWDLVNGLTIQVQMQPKDKFKKVNRIDFFKRSYDYDRNLPESMPCLDDCVFPPMPRSIRDRRGEMRMSQFVASLTKNDWDLINRGLECVLGGGDLEEADSGGSNGHTSYSLPSNQEAPKQEELPHHPPASSTPKPEPVKQAAVALTAEQAGLAMGDMVKFNGQEMKIIHIGKDGTDLRLEDMDEEFHKAKVTDVTKVAATVKAKKQLPDDDEDEDDDFDFDDDE